MSDRPTNIQRVAILAHPRLAEACPEADRIAAFLNDRQIRTVNGLLDDEALRKRVKDHEFDMVIVLGGDGTMLRAGHLCGPIGVPVLGINLGHFGFLMEVRQNLWPEVMPRLLQGDYWLEKRMMLWVDQFRGKEHLGSWEALNEVVVSRGQIVRPIQLVTYLDGRFLTTYVADALIASSATGSTAYAMAAGGPILPPELRNILLVPVAPHLSVEHAIVLAEGSKVSITIKTDHEAVLSIDGQYPISLVDEDRVEVRAGDHTVLFVRFQDPGYFYRNLTPHMNRNPSLGNSK